MALPYQLDDARLRAKVRACIDWILTRDDASLGLDKIRQTRMEKFKISWGDPTKTTAAWQALEVDEIEHIGSIKGGSWRSPIASNPHAQIPRAPQSADIVLFYFANGSSSDPRLSSGLKKASTSSRLICFNVFIPRSTSSPLVIRSESK